MTADSLPCLTFRDDGDDRVYLSGDPEVRERMVQHFSAAEQCIFTHPHLVARMRPSTAPLPDAWFFQDYPVAPPAGFSPDGGSWMGRAWWMVSGKQPIFAYAVHIPPAGADALPALVFSADHEMAEWAVSQFVASCSGLASTGKLEGAPGAELVAVSNRDWGSLAAAAFDSPDGAFLSQTKIVPAAVALVSPEGALTFLSDVAAPGVPDLIAPAGAVVHAVSAFLAHAPCSTSSTVHIPLATPGAGAAGAALLAAHAATALRWTFDSESQSLRPPPPGGVIQYPEGRTRCQIRYNSVAAAIAVNIGASVRARISDGRAQIEKVLVDGVMPFDAIWAALKVDSRTLARGLSLLVPARNQAALPIKNITAAVLDTPLFGAMTLAGCLTPVELRVALPNAMVTIRAHPDFAAAWHAAQALALLEERYTTHMKEKDPALRVLVEDKLKDVATEALRTVCRPAFASAPTVHHAVAANLSALSLADWLERTKVTHLGAGSFLERVFAVVSPALLAAKRAPGSLLSVTVSDNPLRSPHAAK